VIQNTITIVTRINRKDLDALDQLLTDIAAYGGNRDRR
jgi:hypothetical protein